MHDFLPFLYRGLTCQYLRLSMKICIGVEWLEMHLHGLLM